MAAVYAKYSTYCLDSKYRDGIKVPFIETGLDRVLRTNLPEMRSRMRSIAHFSESPHFSLRIRATYIQFNLEGRMLCDVLLWRY